MDWTEEAAAKMRLDYEAELTQRSRAHAEAIHDHEIAAALRSAYERGRGVSGHGAQEGRSFLSALEAVSLYGGPMSEEGQVVDLQPSEEVWADEGGVRVSVSTLPNKSKHIAITGTAFSAVATVASYRADRLAEAMRPGWESPREAALVEALRVAQSALDGYVEPVGAAISLMSHHGYHPEVRDRLRAASRAHLDARARIRTALAAYEVSE